MHEYKFWQHFVKVYLFILHLFILLSHLIPKVIFNDSKLEHIQITSILQITRGKSYNNIKHFSIFGPHDFPFINFHFKFTKGNLTRRNSTFLAHMIFLL